jgi:hypothetical protein
MIYSIQKQKLEPALDRLPALVEAYRSNTVDFSDDVLTWLDEVQQAMASLRLTQGSEITSLKGMVLKAEDEVRATEEKPRRANLKTARNKAAMDAVIRTEEIMRTLLRATEERLQQFEDKLSEGLTALLLQVELPVRSKDTTVWLSQVWELLQQQDATRPLYIYLTASLDHIDRLFIMEKLLSRIQSETG